MKPKPKPTKDTGKDLRDFDNLPKKTKELMISGDNEEHAIGREKVALQKSIRSKSISKK